jgi:LacI family transcriptional regulator
VVSADYRNGNKSFRPTIRDIAAWSGVSVATVSRVLNGRPDVAEKTRERVLYHIRAGGYVANRSARSLVGARTGLIGITVPFVQGEYFTQIVSGAMEALYERDARGVVCPTLHQHPREVSLLDRLMHGTTDGAILILPSESETELAHLRQLDYPFVVVDPSLPIADDIPVVAAANVSGAKVATDHLLALGHRRIAAITGPASWCASIDRLAGYYSALAGSGLTPINDLVVESDFHIEGGYHAARKLLTRADPPTAIFAFNDNMAVGVLRAARELGLTVPGDLSVVGFDDAESASIVTPALTTVRQPLQEMGRVAVSVLYRLIKGQALDVTRIELSTRLVVRDSTGPPSATKLV